MIKYKKLGYVCTERFEYLSKRYGKRVVIEEGATSDGATGAFDIHSSAWWVHDKLCETAKFEDGSPVNAWQAANVLRDILREEGRLLRSYYWHWATFLFGCKKPRENGWFSSVQR